MKAYDILPIAAVIAVIILICFAGIKAHNKSITNDIDKKLETYNTFIVSGVKFKTDDVKDVQSNPRAYSNDVYEFEMTDGTLVEAQEGTIIWYKD